MTLTTLIATEAQEIKFESLDDGPGLLPFRLGQAKVTNFHHTFLQYIQLDDIEDKVITLRNQLSDFKSRLSNDTYSLYEVQINYLSVKIQNILNHLKSLEPNREKRGLVDGLGSVIKSITGNLDYLDAAKFDDAIKVLQTNQFKITDEFNNHVSISKEWMAHHSDILIQIVENQKKINSTLELILDNESYRDSNLIKYAQFAQLLAIITENIDDTLSELIKIENILAFIRNSNTHHSMLKIDILRNMIEKLKLIYSSDRILTLELREYYNIIRPGYYFAGKRIVITFKFPIASKDIFDFYRLTVVPNKFNQSIIPTYPFMASTRQAFMYIETECPKLSNWYLCDEKLNSQVKKQADCVHSLIINQAFDVTCTMTSISLAKEAVDRLDEKHYVISFPKETKIHTICGREDFNTAHGSYLITVPVNCILRIEEFTIANINDRIEGRPLKLMQIPIAAKVQASTSSHIRLNSINLKGLHEAQSKIMLQPTMHIDDVSAYSLYHTTIPIYSILFGAIVLVVIVIGRRFYTKRNNLGSETKIQEPIYTDVERSATQKLPATFSHNFLK